MANPTPTPTTFLGRVRGLLRACLVVLLATPGLGIALLGVACEGTTDVTTMADAHVAIEAPAPELPEPPELVEAPPIVSSTPAWVEDVPAPEPAPAPVVAEPAPAEPAPATGPTRHELDRSTDLAVVESALALDVERRQPVGVGTAFGADADRVWAWVKVRNKQAPTTITMVWRQGERVRSRMTLEVGTSSGWRTWSRRRMRTKDTGAWSIDVLDVTGTVIHTMDFEVTEPVTTAQGC